MLSSCSTTINISSVQGVNTESGEASKVHDVNWKTKVRSRKLWIEGERQENWRQTDTTIEVTKDDIKFIMR